MTRVDIGDDLEAPGWKRIWLKPDSQATFPCANPPHPPQHAPATIAYVLSIWPIRAGVIAVAPLSDLLELRRCSSEWLHDVDLHLFKEKSHLALRPADNGYSYHVAAMTASGERVFRDHTVAWFSQKRGPIMKRAQVVTLPAFRAGAVLRSLRGCAEDLPEELLLGHPLDIAADIAGPEGAGSPDGGAADAADVNLVSVPAPPSTTPSIPHVDAPASPPITWPAPLSPPPTPKDEAPTSPCLSSRWDYAPSEALVPESPVEHAEEPHRLSKANDFDQVDEAEDEEGDEEGDQPTAYELSIRRDYDFPAGVQTGIGVVRLDCGPRFLGESDQAIGGRMPDDVHTVVLRTELRIECPSAQSRFFQDLSRATLARAGLEDDRAAEDALRALSDEYARRSRAKTSDMGLAYHVPVLSGNFNTLVLNLSTMHEDARLSFELLRGPLRRVVVVCGQHRWGGWRDNQDWESPAERRWGVLQELLEVCVGDDVRIDIVDAHRSGDALGCAFEALPRWHWVERDVVADIRYFDSEADVGAGKSISANDWDLWTKF